MLNHLINLFTQPWPVRVLQRLSSKLMVATTVVSVPSGKNKGYIAESWDKFLSQQTALYQQPLVVWIGFHFWDSMTQCNKFPCFSVDAVFNMMEKLNSPKKWAIKH